MRPRVLCLEHHPASPAGLIGERIAVRGFALTTLAAQNGAELPPDAAAFDALLILGGAMNAHADDVCRHFPALLDLARTFAAAEKPVLGICLGAQLLARAFGAKVEIGAARELGLRPVHATTAAADDPLLEAAPAALHLMQWHDDRFALPEGAVPLLEGAICHQGFRMGRTVYAFQPHLEADRQAMRRWLAMAVRDYDRPIDLAAETALIEAQGAGAEAFGRTIADRWLDLVT